MSFNPEYLRRTLCRRSEGSTEAYAKAVESMMSLHASKGMLGSGATLNETTRLAVEHLTAAFNSAATFAYSYTNSHGPEVAEPLAVFVQGFVTDMLDYLKLRGRNTGLDETTVNRQLGATQESLRRKVEQLIDDFTHGMMDDHKMKKDPLVSVTAHQTNSPGAVQQLGVGNFSQTAMVQNHQPLIEAIDLVEKTDEFINLNKDRKALYRAYSEALKEEASEATPSASKMQKHGAKLLEFCKDAGLTAASSTIGEILAKIFVG